MIVKTLEEFEELLQFVTNGNILAYDIETTGLNVRKDKIIGIGVSDNNKGYYIPVQYFTEKQVIPLLNELSKKQLLMFNASFDATFTNNFFNVDLLPTLHTDVLLLKHTCDEEFPFGLKEIAVKLFGLDAKKEQEEMKASIKANGGTPTEFYKADTNILGKYCIQDCLLTYKIFNYYTPTLIKQGLKKFFYEDEVMPLYKNITIPMERTGVKLDVAKIQQYLKDITFDIKAIEDKVQAAIAPHLDLFTKWFLDKEYPLTTATGKMPKYIKNHGTQYDAWQAENDGYMFNLESKHHLKKLFFETLNCQPLNTTDKGNPQVDEEFIEGITNIYPWCEDLILFNKLNKIKSTYYERLLESSEDGIFYPRFQQHRTVSGRYASDLQQLPRPLESGHELVVKYTNVIREFIISRDNTKLVAADYEQLEPTIFAHVSGDSGLQDIFNHGLDFYSEVAIKTERLQNVSSNKKADNYLGKVNKSLRQKAKAYSLGIAYGMTDYKLHFDLGVSQEEAAKLIKDYFSAFPKLAEWINKSHDYVKYYGHIRTQAGRVRHMEQAKTLFEQYGSQLMDSLSLYKRFHENKEVYSKVKEDRLTFKNLMNNAVNFQIQGLAASIVNRAALNIQKRIVEHSLSAKIIINVHDELVYEVAEEHVDAFKPILKHEMENVMKLSVPLKAEPIAAYNLREAK